MHSNKHCIYAHTANANTNKEPVCEAMNKKQFLECLHVINPAITTQEVHTFIVMFKICYI